MVEHETVKKKLQNKINQFSFGNLTTVYERENVLLLNNYQKKQYFGKGEHSKKATKNKRLIGLPSEKLLIYSHEFISFLIIIEMVVVLVKIIMTTVYQVFTTSQAWGKTI